MPRKSLVLMCLLAVWLWTAPLFAHDYQGTVVSAAPASITISVVNESTKKASPMTFDLNKDTKIQRGTKVVSFADARIQKGEKVTITIDHEFDAHLAVVVKLDVKKQMADLK